MGEITGARGGDRRDVDRTGLRTERLAGRRQPTTQRYSELYYVTLTDGNGGETAAHQKEKTEKMGSAAKLRWLRPAG
jgi:hypothetical protein